MDRMRVIELDNPAYSPDLAPYGFWLFARLKKNLAGKHFQSWIDLGNAVWRSLKAIPPEDYKNVFLEWSTRQKRVVDCKCDYFEKM